MTLASMDFIYIGSKGHDFCGPMYIGYQTDIRGIITVNPPHAVLVVNPHYVIKIKGLIRREHKN